MRNTKEENEFINEYVDFYLNGKNQEKLAIAVFLVKYKESFGKIIKKKK